MQSLARQLDFSTWFSRPGRASFGHAKLPPESPIDRVKHLYKDTIKLTGNTSSLVVFAVADALERRLLVKELERKEPEFSAQTKGNLFIYDYATFYSSLRRDGGVWHRGWKHKHVTVICNVDIYYSAAFFLCMIYFMLWAREPRDGTTATTSTSSLRLLTLSESNEVEGSLWECMGYLLPPRLNFKGITLSPVPEAKTAFVNSVWSAGDNFVDAVLKHVSHNARYSQSSIVVCSIRQCAELQRKILELGDAARFRCIENLDFLEDNILKCCRPLSHPNETRQPTLFSLANTSHLPVHFDSVVSVFISDEVDHTKWELGRLVHQDGTRSQREVQQALSYVYQCDFYRSGYSTVAVKHPRLEGLPFNPPPKVQTSEIWSFVASLAILLNADHLETAEIASFFVQYTPYNTTLRQLEVMRFLDWHKPESRMAHDRMYFPREKAVGYVEKLLATLNYDFAAAWFLALGLGDDQATEPAKRAMVYMAAISATEATSHGPSAVFKKSDMYNVLLNTAETLGSGNERNIAQELYLKFQNSITFPHQLWLQGGIWAQLAFFHALYQADPTFSVKDPNLDKLILSDNEENGTMRPEMKGVMTRVMGLDARLDLNLLKMAPIHLSEHDCTFIQSCLSLAWRHCSFLLAVDQGTMRFLDLAAQRSSGAKQHTGDALHIYLAFGSTDTPNGKLVVAVRYLERLKMEKCLAIRDTVVLPFATIGDAGEFYKSVRF